MDELTIGNKHRRRPFVAVMLSLVVTGLGYVYCGRIVKGIVFTFLGSIFVPLISFEILAKSSRVSMVIIGASLLISLLIWLVAIIDSYYIAKHTRPDYELKEYNRWYVYVIYIFIITVCSNRIAWGAKSNLLEAFRVPTLSMFPTIEYHDRFLANKIVYRDDDPKRGDVIVFISPENRKDNYVKRVVAVAGDTVEMKDNQLFINGEKLERESRGRITYVDKDSNNKEATVEGELLIEKNGQAEYTIFLGDTYNSKEFPDDRRADFRETKIPKNHCFVLGDNRNLSMDSRHFGPVPLATVKGRAEYLYWPAKDWSRFGSIK